MKKIMFCEPENSNLIAGGLSGNKILEVNTELYNKIIKAPKIYETDSTTAYIFGKKYPLNTYVRLGTQQGDFSQI
jgi:hypothetical protein